MVKENSMLSNCPFRSAMTILEGKWKLIIIHTLCNKTYRFSELGKAIENISPRMLIKELKMLEQNGIVKRQAYATVPPTVEYSLTEKGKSLKPVMDAIVGWGKQFAGE